MGRRPSRPTLVVLVLLLLQGVFLTWLAKDLWFVWGDDYDFLLMRGTVPGVSRNWLEPHDDHWMTSVIAIYRSIFHFVGIRSYLPYAMVPIVFHLVLAYTMYLVARRVGVGAWLSVAAAGVVAFLGAGGQAVLWTTAMGLTGSVLLAYVAIYVGLRGGFESGRTFWVWLPLILGLTFSGTGVVAVAFVAAFAWCLHGWRVAARVSWLPTAVFIAWYLMFGHSGAKEPLSDPWLYLQAPSYVWTGLTAALGRASGVPEAGGALAIALVVAVLLAPRHIPLELRALGLAGVLAALGQLTLAAVSRPASGLHNFESSRYSYLTMVFLVPGILVCLAIVARLLGGPRPAVMLLVGVLAVSYVVNGQYLFRQDYEDYRFVTNSWPGVMRGIRAAAQAEEQVLTLFAEGEVHKRFRPDLAAHPAMWADLPEGEATNGERLDAEHRFFTSVGEESKNLLVRTDVLLSSGFTTQPPEQGGCSEHTTPAGGGLISVDTGDTGVEVTVAGPGETITTWLERDDVDSPRREWPVKPDTGYFVSTTAKNAELNIEVSVAGTYRFCRG